MTATTHRGDHVVPLNIAILSVVGFLTVGVFAGWALHVQNEAACTAVADLDASDSQKIDRLLEITRSIAMEIIPPPDFRE